MKDNNIISGTNTNDNNIEEENTSTVAVAASSADSPETSDETIAQRLYAMDMLMNVYQFPPDISALALDTVGGDITAACNWILEEGLAADQGGSIIPKTDCPHMDTFITTISDKPTPILPPLSQWDKCTYLQQSRQEAKKTGSLKSEINETDGGCPTGENWMCLKCHVIQCSRYVNGHAKCHYEESGHAIAISLADLSAWCYECQAYIEHPQKVSPILTDLQKIKFADS